MTFARGVTEAAAREIADKHRFVKVTITGQQAEVTGLGRRHRFAIIDSSRSGKAWARRFYAVLFILDESCDNMGKAR